VTEKPGASYAEKRNIKLPTRVGERSFNVIEDGQHRYIAIRDETAVRAGFEKMQGTIFPRVVNGIVVRPTTMYLLPIDCSESVGGMVLAFGVKTIADLYRRGEFEEMMKNMSSGPEENAAEVEILVGHHMSTAVRKKLKDGWHALERTDRKTSLSPALVGWQGLPTRRGRGRMPMRMIVDIHRVEYTMVTHEAARRVGARAEKCEVMYPETLDGYVEEVGTRLFRTYSVA
jgi:hypothetical protein